MTAFDNIKTNNWPATSNDFEDFLVLELPLNDQAALTSSRRDIVAGSKVLFPKRTLTNFGGVSSLAAGPKYSDTLTVSAAHPNNTSPTAGFDGNTATSHIGGVGATATWDARGYSFPPNSTVEVYSYTSNGERSWAVDTGSGYGSEISEVAGWQTLGTYSNIQYIRNSSDANAGYGPGFGAIRINGTVLVDAPGGSKKHYDNNASFSSSKLIIPQHKNFQFGDDNFTIEAYVKPDNVSGTKAIVSTWNPGSNRRSYTLNLSNASVLAATHPDGGSSGHPIVTGGTVTANQWSHVAFVRDGGTLRLFVNGTQVATTTAGTVFSNTTDNLEIGAYPGSTANYFAGTIQDVRIYKGAAKYTSNFTPPSAILG